VGAPRSRQLRLTRRVAIVTVTLATAVRGAPTARAQAQRGWPIYARLCLPCHGVRGDGHGPAAPYVWPTPRAFTRGEMKWRSAPVGQPASDDDVRATILLGAPGTAMPAFAALTPDQQDDVIAVVRAFAPAAIAAEDASPPPIDLGEPPPPDPDRGAALWRTKGCPACHGPTADGHGPSLAERLQKNSGGRLLRHRKGGVQVLSLALQRKETPEDFDRLGSGPLVILAEQQLALVTLEHLTANTIEDRRRQGIRLSALAEAIDVRRGLALLLQSDRVIAKDRGSE